MNLVNILVVVLINKDYIGFSMFLIKFLEIIIICFFFVFIECISVILDKFSREICLKSFENMEVKINEG